jgi:hypothetical protein
LGEPSVPARTGARTREWSTNKTDGTNKEKAPFKRGNQATDNGNDGSGRNGITGSRRKEEDLFVNEGVYLTRASLSWIGIASLTDAKRLAAQTNAQPTLGDGAAVATVASTHRCFLIVSGRWDAATNCVFVYHCDGK